MDIVSTGHIESGQLQYSIKLRNAGRQQGTLRAGKKSLQANPYPDIAHEYSDVIPSLNETIEQRKLRRARRRGTRLITHGYNLEETDEKNYYSLEQHHKADTLKVTQTSLMY